MESEKQSKAPEPGGDRREIEIEKTTGKERLRKVKLAILRAGLGAFWKCPTGRTR